MGEVQRLQKELDTLKPKPKSKARAKKKVRAKAKSLMKKKPSNEEVMARTAQMDIGASANGKEVNTSLLEQNLQKAKNDKQVAQKAKQAEIKTDDEFRLEAARQAEQATLKFHDKLAAITESMPQPEKDEAAESKAKAGKRMMGMLSWRFKGGTKDPASAKKGETSSPKREEDAGASLAQILFNVKMAMPCSPSDKFRQLGGWEGSGAITPFVFMKFLRSTKVEMRKHHVGALWRLGDANCDGQIDCQEFRALFGEMSAF